MDTDTTGATAPLEAREEQAPAPTLTPRKGSPLQVEYTPPPPSVRLDLLEASERTSGHRVMGAALGLCWPYLERRLRSNGVRYNPAEGVAVYGGQVMDYLLGQGLVYKEVVVAGVWAYKRATSDIPGLHGQREAEGNSVTGEDSPIG